MRVMVFVKATKESEAGMMPDEKVIADMGRFKEELVMAGRRPSSTAPSPRPRSSWAGTGSGR
jgi:hypothetical protein